MPEEHAERPAVLDAELGRSGRLDSWKEIANFFKREVRTVQLWERHESLPVHRHQHRKLGTVYAYRPELVQWWRQRSTKRADQKPPSTSGSPSPASPVRPVLTLAVLPFETAWDDDAEWLSTQGPTVERLTERITSQLDRFMPRRLRITCTLAVAQRHAEGATTAEAASQGDAADYLLEGTLQSGADSLRICLRLTRARDSASIWTRDCVYRPDQAESMHTDLAEQVSRALFHHVLMTRHVVKTNIVNPSARYAYLRGRYLWSLRTTPASVFAALEQFKQAIQLDPQHAAAYSGLADCYAVLGWVGALPRSIAMPEARKAALMALALDGSLAEGHVSIGCVLFDFDWDWEGAEREMLQGIALNPSYAQAHCWYGHLLSTLGRAEEAMDATRVAQDMDPASPVVNLFLGNALFHATQYDDAIQQFQHVLGIQPNYVQGHSGLGLAYVQTGEVASAIAHLEFAADRSQQDPNIQAMLAYAYAKGGQRSRAEQLLDRLKPGERQAGCEGPVPAIDAAAAFTALGNPDAAIGWLAKGLEQRNVRLTRLMCDPRLTSLHADPRFHAIAREMRLA